MNRSKAVTEAVQALVREAESVVDVVLDRIATQIPSYSAVPRAQLRPAIAASVHDGIAFLFGGVRTAGAAGAGADRAGRGIAVEDMLRAYRLGVRTVWERFVAEAKRNDADPDEILALAEEVWAWADGVMVQAAREHRQVDLENALDAQRRRAAFIRGALSGTLDRAALTMQAAASGLDPDRAYVPFRARGAVDARAIVAALVPYFPHTAPPVTLLDGDVAGLLARRPGKLDGIVAGLGPPARLGEARAAFDCASRALETAARFGLTGAHDLAGLGLRTAVVADEEVGGPLYDRYLAPLRDLPDVERTVVTYLAGGMQVGDAARALHVHPNTLRNRLRRFEELTGADLRDHATLAELWWALAHHAIVRE